MVIIDRDHLNRRKTVATTTEKVADQGQMPLRAEQVMLFLSEKMHIDTFSFDARAMMLSSKSDYQFTLHRHRQIFARTTNTHHWDCKCHDVIARESKSKHVT